MPRLTRGPAERELRRMIELFLKAETDIINEISRLRSRGLVDYHATAALERQNHLDKEVHRIVCGNHRQAPPPVRTEGRAAGKARARKAKQTAYPRRAETD